MTPERELELLAAIAKKDEALKAISPGTSAEYDAKKKALAIQPDAAALSQHIEPLVKALERAEIAMSICSDWMTEIEMPDGWTTTTDEKLKISEALAAFKGEQK